MMTMITQSETFSNKLDIICRLCLKEEGPMSSIFTTPSCSGSDHHDVLAERITSIAQVQISPSDGLPASICHMCRQQVDKFYDFRLLVEISDRKLRSCFDGVQEDTEYRRIAVRSLQDAKDVDYEEFSVDSARNEKDLLSINAILVPSTSGMQVWQICNVEDEEIIAEHKQPYSTIQENSNECPKLEYPGNDSDLDDFEGVKRCLAQDVTPLSIKAIQNEDDKLYFTSTTTASAPDEDQTNTDNNIHLEIADDEDYEEEHLISEEYSCQLCFKSFQDLEALKSHVSDHFSAQHRPYSSSNASIACKEQEENSCIKNYEGDPEENKIEVEDPLLESKYLDSLICDSCDESFETMEERLHHARRNLNVKGLKCRHCDKSFLKLSSRNYHEESIHGPRSDKTHKCDECGKEFVKRSELRYHKGTHTSSPSTCTICNKHFRNVQSFKMHLKRHTLGSRYNCPDCGKSYYTNSELARHVQQHTGLREYPCDLCDMSFLSKPELNRHVKYHNGVKKFKCKVCCKTYYESGHLKVHERVHTGERPFACTVCEKGFITKSKLVRHFKIHERTRESEQDACEEFGFIK